MENKIPRHMPRDFRLSKKSFDVFDSLKKCRYFSAV